MSMKDGAKAVLRSLALPVVDRVDALVRTFNGNTHLPSFSLRTRTDSWRTTFGGTQWVHKGAQILEELQAFCALRPTDDVLEIGCACGIVALPLKSFLTSGTYTGLDVVPELIGWCSSHLGDARFRFVQLDVQHDLYSPGSRHKSDQVRFPVPEASFDVAFLTSVFTHLEPAVVVHYLSEIRRALNPRGRCLATMLTKDRYRAGVSTVPLRYALSDDCLCWDAVTPSKAYAFSSRLVAQMAAASGLRIRTMAPGSWDGTTQATYAHDMYVFEAA